MARRRTYRGKRRRERRGINAISVSRALNATKDFVWENRNTHITTGQNLIRYGILPHIFNTYQPMEVSAILGGANIANGVGIDTIVTTAGHEASANSATDTNYKVRVFKQHCTYKLRNLSNHPAFLTLYDYVSKVANDDTNNADTLIIEDLYNGWANKLASSLSSNNGATLTHASAEILSWDETVGGAAAPAGYLDIISSQVHPSHSYNFVQNYRLVRKYQYKVEPGDDIIWHVSGPYMDVEPQTRADAGNTPALFKNKTKFTMYRLHGVMGKSTGDDSKVGYMQTDFSCETLVRAKSYRIQAVERSIQLVRPAMDDLTAVTLEGPSDMVHANENG